VKATAAGVVVELPIKVGDQVASGGLVARLAALQELTVEVPVDARLINALHVGQSAIVSIPTIPARQVTGRITLLNPIPAPNMTHVVEVRFPNSSGLILTGQPAEVVFQR
jgi:multidrug efflux pump subunit AcrA (membrane-fusion protein)